MESYTLGFSLRQHYLDQVHGLKAVMPSLSRPADQHPNYSILKKYIADALQSQAEMGYVKARASRRLFDFVFQQRLDLLQQDGFLTGGGRCGGRCRRRFLRLLNHSDHDKDR